MAARRWGIVLAWLSGLMLIDFWLFYDQTVAGLGGRVNNIGLMEDRLIGVLIALGIGALAVVLIIRNPVQQRPIGNYPAPIMPTAFKYPLHSAVHYSPMPKAPTMSQASWLKAVAFTVPIGGFTQTQLRWGHESGVPPWDFAVCVAFIEAYRGWAGIRPPRFRPTALGVTVALSVIALIAVLVYVSKQPKPPTSEGVPAPTTSYGRRLYPGDPDYGPVPPNPFNARR